MNRVTAAARILLVRSGLFVIDSFRPWGPTADTGGGWMAGRAGQLTGRVAVSSREVPSAHPPGALPKALPPTSGRVPGIWAGPAREGARPALLQPCPKPERGALPMLD